MARIKRKGLDYFPLNTDFIHNRIVRRIMKREGDRAFSILISTLSCIYAGEGYYVRADNLFYEDIATCLYQQSAADVRRILALAVEYGIFDAGLFSRYGILTSAEIQEQYLFSTKRRKSAAIAEEYRLSPPMEETDETEETEKMEEAKETKKAGKTNRAKHTAPANKAETASKAVPAAPAVPTAPANEAGTETRKPAEASENLPVTEAEHSANDSQNVTLMPQNVTFGTHSIAQHNITQHNKEYPLLHSSPETGGTPDAGCGEPAGRKEEISLRREEDILPQRTGNTPPQQATGNIPPRKEWTAADIDRLQPPADGARRNLDGLKYSLRQFGIPLDEQYAIILKSNFGIIGHPMWRGFEALRTSHGKIRQPGKYLLSLCWKK